MGLAGLVRLAGSLTVLAAATGLGAAVSLDYRRRIQLLTQLRRMFLLLAGGDPKQPDTGCGGLRADGRAHGAALWQMAEDTGRPAGSG